MNSIEVKDRDAKCSGLMTAAGNFTDPDEIATIEQMHRRYAKFGMTETLASFLVRDGFNPKGEMRHD
jgi:hypothetical protein